MVVIFQPETRQRAQLIWSCSQAGIDHEPGDVSGILACHFDDITELMAWHRAFVMCFGWAPMDLEVMVAESESDF
jgi:hypothetical protein